jgi:hypothetical protein
MAVGLRNGEWLGAMAAVNHVTARKSLEEMSDLKCAAMRLGTSPPADDKPKLRCC